MTDIDPIEELHRIRKKIYAEAGNNPGAYARSLRASQGEEGRKVVSLISSRKNPAKFNKVEKEVLGAPGHTAGTAAID
jgi:hypothetical protein